MTMSCPISSMLTVMRNAALRGLPIVTFPHSNFKWQICQKLLVHSFLKDCKCQQKDNKKIIEVKINYFKKGNLIEQIKIVSKPSQHFHTKVALIRKNCRSWGFYLISTPQGLLTQREALQKNVGGKLILSIV